MNTFGELREALELDLMIGFSLEDPSDLRSTGTSLTCTPEFREFFDPIEIFELFLIIFLGGANLGPTPLDFDLELDILLRCFSILLLCLSVDLYDPLESNEFLLYCRFFSPVI